MRWASGLLYTPQYERNRLNPTTILMNRMNPIWMNRKIQMRMIHRL